MANRPTYAQLEGLVEFLEQNPGITKGLLRTAQGKLETKKKWESLATTLNSLGGANKNGQGWAKTRPTESPVVIEHVETVHEENTAMEYNIRNISPIPSTSQNDTILATSTIPAPHTPLESAVPPRPRRRRSSIPRSLNTDMEQMKRIEARRVEAELITAQAFAQMSENLSNITIALSSIANAILDVAKKMPNP